MKDKLVYLGIFSTLIIVLVWVFYLAFTEPRDFRLFVINDGRACFLVDIRYDIKTDDQAIYYSGKKNSGVLTLHKRKVAGTMTNAQINGLVSGYEKIKNKRIYEYQINPDFIIRDEFVFAGKSPLNLVPYVNECKTLKELHKKQVYLKLNVSK